MRVSWNVSRVVGATRQRDRFETGHLCDDWRDLWNHRLHAFLYAGRPIPAGTVAKTEETQNIEAVLQSEYRVVTHQTRLSIDFREAFRGELVPHDPRNEPASELLARIRTTRDSAPPVTPLHPDGKRQS